MAYEDEKRNSARKQALSGTFGPTPIAFLVHNKMFTTEEKRQITEIAKKSVLEKGRGRIYWEDLQLAIREFRNRKLPKEEIKKKVDEEIQNYDFG